MEVKIRTINGELYIDGRKVLHGWESFTGWYWFAVERVQTLFRKVNGKGIKDTIWFGFVQGFVSEWGDFSQAEIETSPLAWKIPKKDLPLAGRRVRRGGGEEEPLLPPLDDLDFLCMLEEMEHERRAE